MANDNLSDQVYRALKREILTSALAPGNHVAEAALARRFGVSRTPVREALKRLMQDGFIRPVPGVGYDIAPITFRDLQEVFSLRIVLEGEATALATTQISTGDLDALEALLSELKPADLTNGAEAVCLDYITANQRFHLTIARASGHARLYRLIANLIEEADRFTYLETRVVGTQGVEESLRVVAAMRARDAERARACMQDHIQGTRQRTLQAILSGAIPGVVLDRSPLGG